MATIEIGDVQGIILNGYGKRKAAAFVLLQFGEAAGACAWLRDLSGRLTTAKEGALGNAINLALTVDGLRRLGLDDEALGEFGAEYRQGMDYYIRASALGDIGDSASLTWDWGGPSRHVDAVLLLYAETADALEQALQAERQVIRTHGLTEDRTLSTVYLVDADQQLHEHFGFRDALSQPVLANDEAEAFHHGALKPGEPMQTIKPGEILLGYESEGGRVQDNPSVAPERDQNSILPPRPDGRGDLGRNGSYMVLRTLQQHVQGFWRFIDECTANAEERELLAAMLVGRWRSGTALVLSPDLDNRTAGSDFSYHASDPNGHACPFGAHIRRANPRDDAHVDSDPAAALAATKSHRLLRRGRPYGPPLPDYSTIDAMLAGSGDGEERGLHFLCFNANIREQFEFIHWRWLNLRSFAGLSNDADPLVGAEPDGFTIVRPAPRRLSEMRRWVRVRGGAYFFMPGIRATQYLGSLA